MSDRLRKEFVRKTVGPDFPIIVTTYNMVLVEQKWLAKYDWKYVVVDEVKEEHISESLYFYHFYRFLYLKVSSILLFPGSSAEEMGT